MNWNTELETFFERRGQEHPRGGEQVAESKSETDDFMATIAAPAFEAFAASLQKHDRHVRLRLGDGNIRILVDFAGVQEFDFTLWAGTRALSTESHTDGRRDLGSFQNAKGTNSMADTTVEDVAQHLTDRYVALNSGANN